VKVNYILGFVLLSRHGYKTTAPNTSGSLFPRRKFGIQAQKHSKKPEFLHLKAFKIGRRKI